MLHVNVNRLDALSKGNSIGYRALFSRRSNDHLTAAPPSLRSVRSRERVSSSLYFPFPSPGSRSVAPPL